MRKCLLLATVAIVAIVGTPPPAQAEAAPVAMQIHPSPPDTIVASNSAVFAIERVTFLDTASVVLGIEARPATIILLSQASILSVRLGAVRVERLRHRQRLTVNHARAPRPPNL